MSNLEQYPTNEESTKALFTVVEGFSGTLYAFRRKRTDANPVEYNLLENVDELLYNFSTQPTLAHAIGPREISEDDNIKTLAGMHAGVAFTILDTADGSELRGNIYGGINRSGSADFQDSMRSTGIHSARTEQRVSIPIFVNLHFFLLNQQKPLFDTWITYMPMKVISLSSFSYQGKYQNINPRITIEDTEFGMLSQAIGKGSRDLAFHVPNIYYPRE